MIATTGIPGVDWLSFLIEIQNNFWRNMSTKGITIAATLLCLGGVASYFKGNETTKPLALDITLCAAAVAATNHLSGKWHETLAKERFASIESDWKERIETLERTNSKQLSSLMEAKLLGDRISTELAEKTAMIAAYEQQVTVIKSEFYRKTQELSTKLEEEDTRFVDCLSQFKTVLVQDLRARIDKVYNELDSSIQHKLTAQDEDGTFEYQKILIPLQKFRDFLESKYVTHCDLLYEINEFPHTEALIGAMTLYSQICDEIAALKVRYRNVLNIDERRQLEDAYTTLSDCVPKSKAKETLNEYSNFQKNQLNNLTYKIDENVNSLEEMREQIGDLLNRIDLGNLKIAKLQEEIADLRKPHKFIGLTDQATIGNAICDYYFRQGYTLDAADWETTETGYKLFFYRDRNSRYVDLGELNSENHPDKIKDAAQSLNRPEFKQGARTNRIFIDIQRALPVKKALSESDIKLLVGSPEEFVKYVTSHPIRYRLIADPGVGKTPTTAVMLSEILKTGCTKGNTGKGEKVPHTLTSVSYPDAESSQKDLDYPLQPFLKYGNTTAAVKSFEDCLADGKYRSHNTKYAAEFFHIWVWDEFDNTINSADDPKGTGESIKQILKQFGHKNIGWIVSGQSVMTKQLPGFMNDDRRLFTEIIIDIPKIRKYLKDYGSETLSDKVIDTLKSNLDKIEEFIEVKNNQITDDARLLRVALVLDSRSPKLYFLPNLDSVDFDYKAIEDTRRLAEEAKRQILPIHSGTEMARVAEDSQKPYAANNGTSHVMPPKPPIGGVAENGTTPHCPHCGSRNLTLQGNKRYYCLDCKKRSVESRIIWK